MVPVIIYCYIENLVLTRVTGFSMGHACPALQGSEIDGYAF